MWYNLRKGEEGREGKEEKEEKPKLIFLIA